MAGAKIKTEQIHLQCTECKRKNYITTKNKLELKKYCPHDRKHTIHKELKVSR